MGTKKTLETLLREADKEYSRVSRSTSRYQRRDMYAISTVVECIEQELKRYGKKVKFI